MNKVLIIKRSVNTKGAVLLALITASLTPVAALLGCSSKGKQLVDVSGRLVTSDGTSLKGVNLLFWPQQDSKFWNELRTIPGGLTGDRGEFQVTIFAKPGIPPGKYRVTATPVSDESKPLIPELYRRDDTSPLEVIVTASGANTGIVLTIQ